jgi:hypothetical protein
MIFEIFDQVTYCCLQLQKIGSRECDGEEEDDDGALFVCLQSRTPSQHESGNE